VTRIIDQGGGAPRGSELLDGVFFSSDLGERSRTAARRRPRRGRAQLEDRTLVITRTAEDDTIALRQGLRLEIDFGDDGVVDLNGAEATDRLRLNGRGGDDLISTSTDAMRMTLDACHRHARVQRDRRQHRPGGRHDPAGGGLRAGVPPNGPFRVGRCPVGHPLAESQLVRRGGRLPPRAHAELDEHRGHVMVDRADRDDEPLGDLGVRQPVLEEVEHGELARRQPRRIRAGRRPRPARHPRTRCPQPTADRRRGARRAEPVEDAQAFERRLRLP
jgi:hypothetical protein